MWYWFDRAKWHLESKTDHRAAKLLFKIAVVAAIVVLLLYILFAASEGPRTMIGKELGALNSRSSAESQDFDGWWKTQLTWAKKDPHYGPDDQVKVGDAGRKRTLTPTGRKYEEKRQRILTAEADGTRLEFYSEFMEYSTAQK